MTAKETLQYKIFGERNCGTNLLRYLVADAQFLPDDATLTHLKLLNDFVSFLGRLAPRAYDSFYEFLTLKKQATILGWKHAVPNLHLIEESKAKPVFVVKHPSFWLRSFLNRPFHHRRRSRYYRPRSIENLSEDDMCLEDLILTKYAAYRDVALRCNGIVVQYETLVTHFPDARDRLLSLFGHCKELPGADVRNFVVNRDKDFVARHSNQVLGRLQLFDKWKLGCHLDLLSFFGYGVDRWTPTLPFSL